MPLCLHQRAYLCPSSGACKHLLQSINKNARDYAQKKNKGVEEEGGGKSSRIEYNVYYIQS